MQDMRHFPCRPSAGRTPAQCLPRGGQGTRVPPSSRDESELVVSGDIDGRGRAFTHKVPAQHFAQACSTGGKRCGVDMAVEPGWPWAVFRDCSMNTEPTRKSAVCSHPLTTTSHRIMQPTKNLSTSVVLRHHPTHHYSTAAPTEAHGPSVRGPQCAGVHTTGCHLLEGSVRGNHNWHSHEFVRGVAAAFALSVVPKAHNAAVRAQGAGVAFATGHSAVRRCTTVVDEHRLPAVCCRAVAQLIGYSRSCRTANHEE